LYSHVCDVFLCIFLPFLGNHGTSRWKLVEFCIEVVQHIYSIILFKYILSIILTTSMSDVRTSEVEETLVVFNMLES
jgi:hypothetical protein